MTTLIKHKGFSLLELIIVIAVIGVLLTVAFPSYVYYVGVTKASRLNSFATAMMSGARLANGIHLASSLGPSDLLTQGDNLAVYGWPSSSYVCNVVEQQMSNAPDAALSSTSRPISCINGVLQDTSASNPSACKATYHEAGATTSAYVDISQITTANCK